MFKRLKYLCQNRQCFCPWGSIATNILALKVHTIIHLLLSYLRKHLVGGFAVLGSDSCRGEHHNKQLICTVVDVEYLIPYTNEHRQNRVGKPQIDKTKSLVYGLSFRQDSPEGGTTAETYPTLFNEKFILLYYQIRFYSIT